MPEEQHCGTCHNYKNPKKGEEWGSCKELKTRVKSYFWCMPIHWVPRDKKARAEFLKEKERVAKILADKEKVIEDEQAKPEQDTKDSE